MAVSTRDSTTPRSTGASEWLNRNARLLFILPAVIFVLVMIVFPIGYTVWLSFHEWSGSATQSPQPVGLTNYLTLLSQDPRFGDLVIRTFIFSGVAVPVELLLGLGVALLIEGKFWGQNVIKSLILLPMVATPVAIGMAWLLMLEPNVGMFNALLHKVGIPPSPGSAPNSRRSPA